VPAEIEIRVHAERTIKDLVKMQMRMADLMPVMREARRMLELANAENFDSHGLPSGGWAPRRSDYGWPIMRRTGALEESLVNLHGPPNIITPKGARFGTEVDYAKFHQSGTRHMPKRQVMFEPTAFGHEVADAAGDYVARGRLFS
jgi:phage gpG-like protein